MAVPCPALEDTPWFMLDELADLHWVKRVIGMGRLLVRTERSKTNSLQPPVSQAVPSMRLWHG